MNRILYNLKKVYSVASAQLTGRGCKVYWWSDKENFGDLITPQLLRMIGRVPIHTYPVRHDGSHWVMVGSLLQMLPADYSGNILGTGLIAAESRRLPSAKIWSVRGELTKKFMGLPASTATGDPGLLASRLLADIPRKTHVLGIVPHYADVNHPWLQSFLSKHAKDVLIINVQRPARAVIEDIARCHFIASSSLHGIIVADSFHIPNIQLGLSDKVVGANFKFRDYHTSIDCEQMPVACQALDSIAAIERALIWKDAGAIEQRKSAIVRVLQDGLQCRR